MKRKNGILKKNSGASTTIPKEKYQLQVFNKETTTIENTIAVMS